MANPDLPGTPPTEPMVPYNPATDIDINAREAEEALAASQAALDEARQEESQKVAANNDAASQALEALRAGEPLQDEPI